MTNKSTKKALLLSVLSMLMCVAMLVGTTFAWFTDSVTSGRNTIKAGNLDVVLEYWDGDGYEAVDENTKLFDDEALWEPGHTEVAYLKVSNAGTLALKYQLAMNIYGEQEGTNVADETFKLSDYIKYGVVATKDKDIFATREDAIAAVSNSAVSLSAYSRSGDLLATENGVADVDYVAIVVYMPTTVGNEANYKTGTTAPSIVLGVELFATQMVSESDFFGPDYDAAAPWTGSANYEWYTENLDATEFVINSAEDLAGLAEIVNGTAVVGNTLSLRSTPVTLHDDFKGKTVKLNADLDLRDIAWTPIGRTGATTTDFNYSFKGTFDGQGFTVSNLNVNNEGWAGLFGIAHSATLKNVKLSGVRISSNRMAGSLVGQLYGNIDNCHVTDATVKVIPNKVGDEFDNGDKVGGIVGWLGDNGNNRTLINCSATDVQISAYRDVAAIAGYVASSTVISGNKVTDAQVTVDQINNYYGDKDFNAGLVYGRKGGAVNDDHTSVTDEETCSISEKYVKDGLEFRGNGKDEVTLHLVPADYESDTVTVPEGVTTIGNYAFAYNSNVETVILPESVTDLGRGFDSSTVEKVVLNDGLETISSRAFKSTAALEEVVISSTVTTIADNAFQKSGIKKIVIPANVKTVGETAFGASKIETVIFEGDIDVQGFAFRGCPDLRTVYFNGDANFVPSTLSGKNSMWFCNGESNNPNTSNITFYVINEDVAQKVKTAMGAEANNTTVIVGNVEVTKDPEVIKDALANGGTVVLPEDVKTEAATTAPYGNKVGVVLNGGVLDGNGNKLNIECYGDDYGIMTSGGTIKNLIIEEGCRAIVIMSPTEDIIIDNVYVCGDILYPINTAEHATVAGVDLIVTNSTFGGWSSFAGIDSASFTDCTFVEGDYGYGWPYETLVKPYINTTFTNCEFALDGKGNAYYLDLSSLGAGCTVTLKNCTVNGVTVTAENCTNLFGEVELPSGRVLADCVVFQ